MKNYLLKSGLLIMLIVFSLLSSKKTSAHCEVPCGIYGDSVRIAMLYEDIATIEKAMNQIKELSKAEEVNYNQLIRWVNTKEEHAEKIQNIISEYFLHQRIKITPEDDPNYQTYVDLLKLMHEMLVYSMKAKQTTDLEYINKLKETLANIESMYFHEH